jgi:hypothetical protein
LWLKITLPNITKYICCLYLSPNSTIVQVRQLFNHLSIQNENIQHSHPDAEVSFLGDFNVHNTEWLTHSSHTDQAGLEAEAFCVVNDLTQLVEEPTRIPDCASHKANTLDLFITNKPELYSNITVSPPIGSSDHLLISVRHSFQPFKSNNNTSSQKRWFYKKAKWDDLRQFYGEFPWSTCFSSDPSLTALSITEIIREGMDSYIPHSTKPGKKYSPSWFDRRCHEAVLSKERAFQRWKTSPGINTHVEFIAARNICKRTILLAKRSFIQKTSEKLASLPNSSKSFWSVAKRISKNFCTSSFPPIINSDGKISSTPQDKANVFAAEFSKNSNLDDSDATPPASYGISENQMPPINFKTNKIRSIIKTLDQSKACGPDGIPPIVLKNVLQNYLLFSVSSIIFPSTQAYILQYGSRLMSALFQKKVTFRVPLTIAQ